MPTFAVGKREATASRDGGLRVWDPVVRLFHWGVVSCCALNLFLLPPGKIAHRYVGYTALTLVSLRLVWGFIGTRHARFSDFVRGPAAVLKYLCAFAAGKTERHMGHNPAAGWMTTFDAFWGNKLLEEVHEFLANSIMILAGIHALAAILESWHLKENLIWSMVTGRKKA